MERYNPPSTSAQMYCHGCQRQIRKVQELMDERYLDNIAYHVDKNTLETKLDNKAKELELEKFRTTTLTTLLKRSPNPEAMDERVKEIMEVNKKMAEELQKTIAAPLNYPLEEWYNAINLKWNEKYDELRVFLIEKNNQLVEYQDMETELSEDIDQYCQEIAALKKMLKKKDEEIEELKKSAAKENFSLTIKESEKKGETTEEEADSGEVKESVKDESEIPAV
ncbi:Protein CBG03735 [Caenorhabditis briggsae]|uniref:Uncharacterized protein n=2 Tax=Caenorhabditis briggsae TaxID=6238 RepID=A0AAE9IZ09_CAEBR|nr:Protein CBG03735 [Caenorhabditis briggsae]ULU11004.1 hypothetical protein L3Y34_014901 [Caenorhabditis briggsae]UMM11965.1 hypothetical protein L5515_000979 [Caenorhabditis briggsae]CAP24580.1 Protein CBG03735 [Caenorhabditis briggsae]